MTKRTHLGDWEYWEQKCKHYEKRTHHMKDYLVKLVCWCLHICHIIIMSKVKLCSFRNCQESSSNANRKFFNFRKHDYQEWITACQKTTLLSLKKESVTNNYFVCDKHFIRENYTKIISPFKKRLNRDAIPNNYDCIESDTERGKFSI